MTNKEAKQELNYILTYDMTHKEIVGHVRILCNNNNITGSNRTTLITWALDTFYI